MNETPQTPFAPFQPSPPVQPETPQPRQKRKAKAETPAQEPPAAQPRQKRKKAAVKTRAPKFDLQTILAAASELKEADMPAFEKMIGMLQDAGKPGRARLLTALGKIFA